MCWTFSTTWDFSASVESRCRKVMFTCMDHLLEEYAAKRLGRGPAGSPKREPASPRPKCCLLPTGIMPRSIITITEAPAAGTAPTSWGRDAPGDGPSAQKYFL